MIRVDLLSGLPGLRHAFFTREGGVSTGVFESLNCGLRTADDPECVAGNRARAMARLEIEPDALVTACQVHGAGVAIVERPWAPDRPPEADGLVSRAPGIALGVLTADCAPVLLADSGAGIIGAAHAGWRGALRGVIEETVAAMEQLGARRTDIAVAIGPCIAQKSYEVGPEFPGPFLAEDTANECFFLPGARDGHSLFDLAGFVAHRLSAADIARIQHSGGDTVAEDDRFFSYRRTRLEGKEAFGLGLSAIALSH